MKEDIMHSCQALRGYTRRHVLRALTALVAGVLIWSAVSDHLAWAGAVDATGVTANAPPYPGTVLFRAEEDPADPEPYRLHSDMPPVVTMEVNTEEEAKVKQSWKEISSSTPVFDQAYHNEGVLMHWSTSEAYQYFWKIYGYQGFANDNNDVTSFVLKEAPYSCSFVHDSGSDILNYIQCGTRWGALPMFPTMIDSIGHEFTHAINQHKARLPNFGEGGALNESFADIFGLMLKFSVYPLGVGNWNFAEHGILYPSSPSGPVLRYPPDPHWLGHPATYGDDVVNGKQLWKDPANKADDKGGVHTNCEVQNHWFYLLAEGGAGTNGKGWSYQVTGIGKQPAANITFLHMIEGLDSTADFMKARENSLSWARKLCGTSSQ
jgi:Zn-dependent metalloprotease